MNFPKDNMHIMHVEKKHKCMMCDFRTHKKYNLNIHTRNKHGINTNRALSAIPTGVKGGQTPLDIRHPPNIQVNHHTQEQYQHNNDNRGESTKEENDEGVKSSKGETDKFDRLYQAVHGKPPNVNQSQERNCDYPQCRRECCDDIHKVSKEFNINGVECFTKCSNKEIQSVCFIATAMMTSFLIERLKDYRPHQYKDACQLLTPYSQSVEQLACHRVSVQEKRKILQQTNLGVMLLLIAVKLVIPTLVFEDNKDDIINRFFR